MHIESIYIFLTQLYFNLKALYVIIYFEVMIQEKIKTNKTEHCNKEQ